ncbi:MAG TPA: YncE family protein, partial [Bacteroidia bacterium]|nr:YncE family protein [Bacteroidia bacterium]
PDREIRDSTAKNEALKFVQSIPLPGVKGRIDHMAYDVSGQRIFICALGNGSVEIVDLKSGKVIHSINHLAEPQGIVFDSAGKRIFVACGDDGYLRVFNTDNYLQTDSIKIGSDADNVRYDLQHTIYVAYDGGMAVVDATRMKVLINIELDGHPESFQMNHATGKMFVNVPDAYEIQMIDLKKNVASEKWVVTDARDNFPMALDNQNHRLFIACRHPSRILVMDQNSGRVITAMECSEDADDIYYDADAKELIASCGQGYIDFFKAKNDSMFTSLPRMSSRFEARTSLYNSGEKKYFLAVPAMPGKEAELRVYTLNY